MYEEICEALGILADSDAPEQVIDQFQDIKNVLRYQPSKNVHYDIVAALSPYLEAEKSWAIKVYEICIGKWDTYDPSRDI